MRSSYVPGCAKETMKKIDIYICIYIYINVCVRVPESVVVKSSFLSPMSHSHHSVGFFSSACRLWLLPSPAQLARLGPGGGRNRALARPYCCLDLAAADFKEGEPAGYVVMAR